MVQLVAFITSELSSWKTSHIFLLNCDVCCNFPLLDMLEAHEKYREDRAKIFWIYRALRLVLSDHLYLNPTHTGFPALKSSSLQQDFVRLDQDILSPLAGKNQLYIYEMMDFWEQTKTPGGNGISSATIISDVYIHPSAKVHPTAKQMFVWEQV